MKNVQIYVPHFALSISHATTITEPHESAHLPAFQMVICYRALHSTPRTRTTELSTLGIFLALVFLCLARLSVVHGYLLSLGSC